MCLTSCLMLYSPGTPLDKVTCPCGVGYWDIFKQRFVDGASVRKGKEPPRQDHEARVKRMYSPEKYEAILRHQWIVHFLDCEIKAQMDAEETSKGRNDGSTLRLAMAELQEFSSGDYSGSRRRATSTGRLETSSSRHPGWSSSESTVVVPASEMRMGSTTAIFSLDQSSSRGYFVPTQWSSLEVLKHHQQKGTFGRWRSIEQTTREGKSGYLIHSDTPIDRETIERLMEDTKTVEAKRKGTKIGYIPRSSSKELSPAATIANSPPDPQARHRGGQSTSTRREDESDSDDTPVSSMARGVRQLKTDESRRTGIDRRNDPDDRDHETSSKPRVTHHRHGSRYDSEEERRPSVDYRGTVAWYEQTLAGSGTRPND